MLGNTSISELDRGQDMAIMTPEDLKEVRFGRALSIDSVVDLGEDAWQCLRAWLIDQQAPEAILNLASNLLTITSFGQDLLRGNRLIDSDAQWLAQAFVAATIALYEVQNGEAV